MPCMDRANRKGTHKTRMICSKFRQRRHSTSIKIVVSLHNTAILDSAARNTDRRIAASYTIVFRSLKSLTQHRSSDHPKHNPAGGQASNKLSTSPTTARSVGVNADDQLLIEIKRLGYSSLAAIDSDTIVLLALRFAIWLQVDTFEYAPWLAPFAVRRTRVRT